MPLDSNPFRGRAPLISIALRSALDGRRPVFSKRYCLATAAVPLTSGVAIEVPDFLWVAHPLPAPPTGAALIMLSPGATTSGFILPSSVGPPLENEGTFSCFLGTLSEGPVTESLTSLCVSSTAMRKRPALAGTKRAGMSAASAAEHP